MNDASMTARLGLALLDAGQAQKEVTHNEALALLDLAVQASVEAVGVNAPPVNPAPGACWVIGEVPSGDWAGRAGALAGWTAGGWRFVAPTAGMSVWSKADACAASFSGEAWTIGRVAARELVVDGIAVVGARRPAIAGATGGGMIDIEARAALDAVLQTLREHGLIAR